MNLMRPGYRPRLVDYRVELMMGTFGAVCMEGPILRKDMDRAEPCGERHDAGFIGGGGESHRHDGFAGKIVDMLGELV